MLPQQKLKLPRHALTRLVFEKHTSPCSDQRDSGSTGLRWNAQNMYIRISLGDHGCGAGEDELIPRARTDLTVIGSDEEYTVFTGNSMPERH